MPLMSMLATGGGDLLPTVLAVQEGGTNVGTSGADIAIPVWLFVASNSAISTVLISAVVALYKRQVVIEDRRAEEIRLSAEASRDVAHALKDMADAISTQRD